MSTTVDHDAEARAMLADMAAAHAEPWCEELAPYVTTGGGASRFPMVAHPLVHEVFPIPGLCNARYRHKVARLAEAEAAGDLHTCVFLHERPYRTEALIDYAVGRDEWEAPLPLVDATEEVRQLAADVWVDSENLHQHTEDWEAMFEGAHGLMLASEEEAAEFAALPDTLTVHRGVVHEDGWSWTLNRETAEWFATRFDRGGRIETGTVPKAAVFGYFTRRGEAEVLTHPGAVTLLP